MRSSRASIEALDLCCRPCEPAPPCTCTARSAAGQRFRWQTACSRRQGGAHGRIARVVAAGRIQHHAFGGVEFGAAVGQHRLHQLEFGNRAAELPALHGERAALLAQHPPPSPTAWTAARWMRPRSSTFIALRKPRAGNAADDPLGRHAHILKYHIAGLGAALAHLAVRPPEAKARWNWHRQWKAGHAIRPGCRGLTTRHHREQGGTRGVGDPALGAVQHIVLALSPGGGAQRGGIRSGVRFRQSEGDDRLAAGDARQEAAFLLLGAVDQDASRTDADIGAKDAAERQRRAAMCSINRASCSSPRPSPPYSSGMDKPKRPRARISSTSARAAPRRFPPPRPRPAAALGDETRHGGLKQGEGFGIDGHTADPPAGFMRWRPGEPGQDEPVRALVPLPFLLHQRRRRKPGPRLLAGRARQPGTNAVASASPAADNAAPRRVISPSRRDTAQDRAAAPPPRRRSDALCTASAGTAAQRHRAPPARWRRRGAAPHSARPSPPAAARARHRAKRGLPVARGDAHGAARPQSRPRPPAAAPPG